jgi:hypothetical protein
MTRSWNFTLSTANVWYNLWTLIKADPSFTDFTFGNSPYVPNMVSQLKWQNNTPGSNLYKSDSKLEAGFGLPGASWDVDFAQSNNIDLNNVNFKTDTEGATFYVSIIAG